MDERIIDFEQVAEDGEKLKNYAVELYECLMEMRTKFNNSARKFEEFKKVINDYGQYLVTYAEGQKENEQNFITAITEGIGEL